MNLRRVVVPVFSVVSAVCSCPQFHPALGMLDMSRVSRSARRRDLYQRGRAQIKRGGSGREIGHAVSDCADAWVSRRGRLRLTFCTVTVLEPRRAGLSRSACYYRTRDFSRVSAARAWHCCRARCRSASLYEVWRSWRQRHWNEISAEKQQQTSRPAPSDSHPSMALPWGLGDRSARMRSAHWGSSSTCCELTEFEASPTTARSRMALR